MTARCLSFYFVSFTMPLLVARYGVSGSFIMAIVFCYIFATLLTGNSCNTITIYIRFFSVSIKSYRTFCEKRKQKGRKRIHRIQKFIYFYNGSNHIVSVQFQFHTQYFCDNKIIFCAYLWGFSLHGRMQLFHIEIFNHIFRSLPIIHIQIYVCFI